MRLLFAAALLFNCLCSYAQSFEGTITYVTDMEVGAGMAKMGLTKKDLMNRMKADGSWSDTIRITYKKGNYFSRLYTDPLSWSVYTASSNRIYMMQEGEDSFLCTVTDASIDPEKQLSGNSPKISKLDTTAIINGDTCSIIRVEWKSGTYDYYYSSSAPKVDPSLFANHVYEGWAEYLKLSGVLPVRIVKKAGKAMIFTMTMVSAKKEAVSDDIFRIPKLRADDDLNPIKTPGQENMRIIR